MIIEKNQISTILCIKPRGIGDVVLSTIIIDNLKAHFPYSNKLYGDNAAMIAFRGMKSYEHGLVNDLDFSPYPGLTPKHFS